jgi:peptide/nickel transport system substrate-binding protein
MPADSFDEEELSGPVVDRRTTVSLLGAAGLTGLAGCVGGGGEDTPTDGDDEEDTDTPTGDVSGGRLQAGWFTGEISNLDPPFISVGQYFQLAANVFNGLTTLTPELDVRGDLAEDWTVSDDGTQYTFQLREGVTFHNGTEFSADDVEYTIRRTIEEEAPAAGKLGSLLPLDEGGVEVLGDYEVRLNLESPNAVMLIYLTRGPGRAATIVNQEAIEELGQDQYTVTPVGTGPFEVVEHDVGNSVTLDAYDDYFETDDDGTALPYLDGVDVQMIPEAASVVNALQSGDIHFSNLVPLQNISQVADSGSADIDRAPGINWLGFAMNQEREPFGDRQVRRAIAKLIDNERFVQEAYFGNALPNNGVLNKATSWVWRGDDKPQDQAFAPEEGQQLLADAGAEGASFGILTAQGDTRAAQVMRNLLTQYGLDVSVDQVTTSTYWTRYEEGDYDTTISGSVIDPDPEQSLWNFYRLPDQDGVWNWVTYRSEEVHQLLAEQRAAQDRDQRRELLWDIEDQLIADVPHAYLLHQDDIAGIREEIGGFTHIPGMRPFHTIYLDE